MSIGVRLAVGATRRNLIAVLLRDVSKSILAGLAIGMMLAVPVALVLRGALYGIEPWDALAAVGAVIIVVFCAVGACLIGAARVSQLDVAQWLRSMSR